MPNNEEIRDRLEHRGVRYDLVLRERSDGRWDAWVEFFQEPGGLFACNFGTYETFKAAREGGTGKSRSLITDWFLDLKI